MSGFLFDTNVLLDIATADPVWLAWSENQFRTAAAQGPILVNPIIYAELAPAFASAADLDRWLDPAVFQRLPLPYAAGWLAAQAFFEIPSRRRRREDFAAAGFLHRVACRN
jgi:predicted nucleic acid-binding protein